MKNGYLVEGTLVVLGGFVVPMLAPQHAGATTVFDVGPGNTSVVSHTLSSAYVSGVLVSGGGTVVFTTSNNYSGGTVVDGGSTLSINQDAGLGVNTGTLVLGDAISSGVLDLNYSSGSVNNQISASLVDEHGILINSGGGTIITNSGDIVSATSGGATTTSSYVADFEGIISGTGKLTVTGGGTLELTNNNVWVGGALVESGSTLEVGHQSNLGAVTNLVTLDSGTLAFDQGRTFKNPFEIDAGGGIFNLQGHKDVISSVISGAGTLTVLDANSGGVTSGVLTLNQTEAYTGNTVVEGGTLRLDNGSLIGDVTVTNYTSTTNVLSGSGTSATTVSGVGALAGIGTVEGDVTVSNGGSVTPGINGSGTLNVDGDFTLNSGTTLNINVGSGGAGELNVGGDATLDGNLVLKYTGFAKAGTYQYINVTGGTTGGFTAASTTDDLFGAGLSSDVEANSVTLTQNSALPTGDLPTLIVATTDVAVNDAQFSNRLLLDRLQTVRTTALAQRDEVALSDHHEVRNLSPYGLWVAPLGGFGSGNGGGAPGYTYGRYGFIGGVDGVMAPGWVNGIALEYTHQHISQSGGGTASIGTPRIMAYTGFWRGPYAVDLTLGDGAASISTSRSYAATLTNVLYGTTTTNSFSGTADGSRSANELTAALQASGNYLIHYRWAISPAVGVKLARLSTTGLTETGSDYFDYSVAHQHANSVRPYVNVQVARRYYFENGAALLPTAKLGVEGEVGDRNNSIQAMTAGDSYVWTIPGVKPATMSMDVDLGVAYETSKRQSFSVKFMGTESANGSDQTILGQYGLRF